MQVGSETFWTQIEIQIIVEVEWNDHFSPLDGTKATQQ